MSKHMISPDGKLLKVSKTLAAEMYEKGRARYISKDEYKRRKMEEESNGKR